MTLERQQTVSIPDYLQLKISIMEQIRRGLLKPGNDLPPDIELCEKYKMDLSTIRITLALLEEEGYVHVTRSGVATVAHRQRSVRRDSADTSPPSAGVDPGSVEWLPTEGTSFSGRDEAVREIDKLLERPETRLATLTGPGGVGKSRLAVHVAKLLHTRYEHGTYFVALTSETNPDNVVPAIARACKLPFHGATTVLDQLIGYLHEKHILFVLDNLQHLTEAKVHLARIIEETKYVQLLVTSRQTLEIEKENIVEIGGLKVADESDENLACDAVSLFIDRARMIDPDYKASPHELRAMVRLCSFLKGMPLGIELAAAHVDRHSCDEILSRLERDSGFLLDDMKQGVGGPSSMRSVFEQSWNALSKDEQQALKRASVFSGGFQSAAMEAVTGISSDVLDALVRHSLLHVDSRGRYRFHELLRRFAQDKLEERPNDCDMTRNLHVSYYSELVSGCAKYMETENEERAYAAIEAEIDNIRGAWRHAVEQEDVASLGMLAGVLYAYYESHDCLQEAAECFRNALAMLDRNGMAGSKEPNLSYLLALRMVLSRYGVCLFSQCRYDEAEHMLNRSLEVSTTHGLREGVAYAQRALAGMAYHRGQFEEAARLFDSCLQQYKDLENKSGIAGALFGLGSVADMQGDCEKGRACWKEALAIYEEMGHRASIYRAQKSLGFLAKKMGNYKEACELLECALKGVKTVGYPWDEANVTHCLAVVAAAIGDFGRAQRLDEEALAIFEKTGTHWGVGWCLDNLGAIALNLGKFDEARLLLEHGLTNCELTGDLACKAWCLHHLGLLEEQQDNSDQAERYIEQAHTIREKIGDRHELPLALIDRARLKLKAGQQEKAQDLLVDAMDICRSTGIVPLKLAVLAEIAALKAEQGDTENAVEIATCVSSSPAADHPTRRRAVDVLSRAKESIDARLFDRAVLAGRELALDHACQRCAVA